jgi:transcriptional regulator with GAF, ATPase, and Fis domain
MISVTRNQEKNLGAAYHALRMALVDIGVVAGPSAHDDQPVDTTQPIVRLPQHGVPLGMIERLAIIEALRMCGWVQSEAAKLLHLTPRVINYRIQSLGIVLPVDHPHVRKYAVARSRRARRRAVA